MHLRVEFTTYNTPEYELLLKSVKSKAEKSKREFRKNKRITSLKLPVNIHEKTGKSCGAAQLIDLSSNGEGCFLATDGRKIAKKKTIVCSFTATVTHNKPKNRIISETSEKEEIKGIGVKITNKGRH